MIKIKHRNGELWNRMFLQTLFRITPHGEEHVINLEAFGQIVDEANKEFPQCETCKVRLSDSCCSEDECPRTKWALEWLGES